MTIDSLSTKRRSSHSLRWGTLLAASILLHIVALDWADGRIGMLSWRTQEPPVVMMELHAPPAAATPAPPKPVAPKPKSRPRRHLPPAPPPVMPAAGSAPVLASSTAPEIAAEPIPAAQESSAKPEENQPPQAETMRYKVSPPPSAELKYQVQALIKGQNWHGDGLFRWELNGNAYQVSGEATVPFIFRITVLNFRSEGVIDDFGIAPMLYSEKPFRKSMTNTHFQHEQRKISFSASEAVYPYNGGEQDRASIIWQLAGIGRGDPSQFVPGTDIDVVVAGTRDVDTWRIRLIGEEDIETTQGKVHAWHVVRIPRPGSYDQTIDIWLAPQQEWYPVKLRYTYANGDYLDLSLAGIQ